jgi:pimeloyl-ACP methyl ester carboxylesterase
MDWERAGCRTIEGMAGWYAAAIRRRQPRGPYRLLGTSFGGIIAFEIALQLRRAGDAVALLAMVDTVPPDCEGPNGIDRAERNDRTATIDRSDSVVRMGAQVADAHRAALDRYLLRERFDGTITYFRCSEVSQTHEKDRRALWARFAAGGIRILPVPGVHGCFHREPQLSALVAGLCACLGAP